MLSSRQKMLRLMCQGERRTTLRRRLRGPASSVPIARAGLGKPWRARRGCALRGAFPSAPRSSSVMLICLGAEARYPLLARTKPWVLIS
jgi:hypothetical protein